MLVYSVTETVNIASRL